MAALQDRVARNKAAIQLLTKHIRHGRQMIWELRQEQAVLDARFMETRNLQADKEACTTSIRELIGIQRDLRAIRRFRRTTHLQLGDRQAAQSQVEVAPVRRIRLTLRVHSPLGAHESVKREAGEDGEDKENVDQGVAFDGKVIKKEEDD